MEYYEKNCQKCREKTYHRIVIISRTRGLKLKCLICGYKSQKYYNANNLEEVKQLE